MRRVAPLAVLVLAATAARAGDGDAPPPPQTPGKRPPPLVEPPPPPCTVTHLAKGDGRAVAKGDLVSLHLVIRVPGAKVAIVDTHLEEAPQTVRAGAGSLPQGIEETLLTLHAGDRVKVAAPWERMYGHLGYGRSVPAKTDLEVEIEVLGFVEIEVTTLQEGTGDVPLPGAYVAVHYTAMLPDGKEYDDSRKQGTPLVLVMGDGTVIEGWELTMRRMRVGQRVKAVIPWQLAYGVTGKEGVIPPKANLTFDIERLPLPEIRHEVILAGEGARCRPGREIRIGFRTMLADGTEIARSPAEGTTVVLGLHRVVPAWELTIAKMRIGDKWRVHAPWLLCYGAQGDGKVPPRTDLDYEIEIRSMK